MTAAAVLAQLQSAWNAAPALPPTPATVPLIVSPLVEGTPKRPARCPIHTDAGDWLDEPDDNRRGWIRTSCRRCGAFIGYRPTDNGKKTKG